MKADTRSAALAVAAALALSGCGGGSDDSTQEPPPVSQTQPPAPPPPAPPASGEKAPEPVACPPAVPSTASCLAGLDSRGAYYLIAKPAVWNGKLVLHAHGGPSLDAPTAERATE